MFLTIDFLKKIFLSSFDVIDVLYNKQLLLDIIYIVYILLTEYFFLIPEAYKYYKVFVTNPDLPALTSDTECASFSQNTNQYTKGVITCKRVLNGNQVVIRIENNFLQLHEINVYRRFYINNLFV